MNRERKSVLFVVPSLRRAGAETQLIDLINGLDASLFKKHLFTYRSYMDQYDRLDIENIKFFNSVRKHKFDFSPVKDLARIIDEYEIETIHCTLQFSLLLAWLARKLSHRNPKLITAVHTTVNQRNIEEIQDRFVHSRLLKACENVVFVCKTQMEHWIKKFPQLESNSCFVHNGVDLDFYNPGLFSDRSAGLRDSLNIPEDAVVISSIAGFRKEKGHTFLIEAFSKLPDNCYLILAGDGVQRPVIEKMIKDYNMQGNVRLLGNIDDVRPLLKLSDLMVLASTAVETFSMAMLEAMAMETPVAATDIGGMKEAVINDETGYLFPPGDEEILYKVLKKSVQSRDVLKQMGNNARKLVLHKFSDKKMVRETSKILNC